MDCMDGSESCAIGESTERDGGETTETKQMAMRRSVVGHCGMKRGAGSSMTSHLFACIMCTYSASSAHAGAALWPLDQTRSSAGPGSPETKKKRRRSGGSM